MKWKGGKALMSIMSLLPVSGKSLCLTGHAADLVPRQAAAAVALDDDVAAAAALDVGGQVEDAVDVDEEGDRDDRASGRRGESSQVKLAQEMIVTQVPPAILVPDFAFENLPNAYTVRKSLPRKCLSLNANGLPSN